MSAVNETVVFRHAEDIAFVWSMRRRALRTCTLTHAERVRLDKRLEGHIDGALVAGEAAWRTCLELRESFARPGSAFAVSILALRADTSRAVHFIPDLATDEPSFREIVSAIGWSSIQRATSCLDPWRTAREPALRRLALAGYGALRLAPGGAPTSGLAPSDTPPLQATAAKVAGELGATGAAPSLRELLRSDDGAVRFEAARALVRLGERTDVVRAALLESTGEHRARGACAVVRMDVQSGVDLVRSMFADPLSRRAALVAAAMLGLPDVIPDLVHWMSDDEVARTAADCFCALTGADGVASKLYRTRPPRVPGAPNDDPGNDHVEMDDEYPRPFPEPEAFTSWWSANRSRFAPGTRYLDGRAVGTLRDDRSPDHLGELIALARASRPSTRRVAAFELAHVTPRVASIEVDAPATGAHDLPGWDATIAAARTG